MSVQHLRLYLTNLSRRRNVRNVHDADPMWHLARGRAHKPSE